MMPIDLLAPVSLTLLGAALLSALLPLRWFVRVYLLANTLVLAMDNFRPQGMDAGNSGLLLQILGALLIVSCAIAAVRFMVVLGIQVARRLPGPGAAGPREQRALDLTDIALAAVIGLYVGGHFILSLAAALSGRQMGYLLHVAMTVLAGGVLTAVAWPLLRRSAFTHRLLRVSGMAASGLVLLASVSGLGYPFYVSAAMQAAADGRPHCLYLGDRKRAARSLQELTLFTMDKSEVDIAAMMYVKGTDATYLYPWTYYGGQFQRNDYPIGPGAPRCTPEAGFAQRLPLF